AGSIWSASGLSSRTPEIATQRLPFLSTVADDVVSSPALKISTLSPGGTTTFVGLGFTGARLIHSPTFGLWAVAACIVQIVVAAASIKLKKTFTALLLRLWLL